MMLQSDSFFKDHRAAHLQKRLQGVLTGLSIQDYSYIIKGDISGIQEFIFSVTSNKASKSLKGRSFFVQALSKLGIRLLEEHPDLKGKTWVFYDGGGNFYLLSKVPTTKAVNDTKEVIDEYCKSSEIYLSLAETTIANQSFYSVWSKINRLSNEAKLKKFESNALSFIPYPSPKMERDAKTEEDFEQDFRYDLLTDDSLRHFNHQFGFDPASTSGVDGLGVAFFGAKMVLGTGTQQIEDWVNGLPKWTKDLLPHSKQREWDDTSQNKSKPPREGNIIEFSDLAHFAHARTGTEKLAVLKMDVDNLGQLFNDLAGWPDAKQASTAMSWFFGAFMSDLLQTSFEYEVEEGKKKTARFSDNIYVVFSGGDDTFMVGAWDAVFEFAYCLHRQFKDFTAELQKYKIKGLPEKITLSAALVLIDSKFPVVRFAEQAEDALNEAKKWEDTNGNRPKNKVSVFDQVLDWEEFEYARDLGIRTAELIKFKGEPRAIIERIKQVAYDYERLQERVVVSSGSNGGHGPKVHRLFYTMRDLKNLKSVEKDIQAFSASLLEAFTKGKKMSYPKFPVAARWAEFLTRK